MKRPAFQFYPDNWRSNANLRRCSWAARGVWIDVMCLMHDSDRYGVLEWSLKEIAQAIGCPLPLLRELVAKGVMKGCDEGQSEAFIYTPRSGRKDGVPVPLVPVQQGPVWFSSRMVKDEYIRGVRGDETRFGQMRRDASKQPPSASPMAPKGEAKSDGPPSPSPSPTSVSKNPPTPQGGDGAGQQQDTTASRPDPFDEFWKAYPRKTGKDAARKSYALALRRGAKPEAILAGLKRTTWDTREGGRFIAHPSTWLNQGRWQDEGFDLGRAGEGDDDGPRYPV